jgi:hypothetical protein
MVLHKHGDYLYNGVKTTVREHLEEVAKVHFTTLFLLVLLRSVDLFEY